MPAGCDLWDLRYNCIRKRKAKLLRGRILNLAAGPLLHPGDPWSDPHPVLCMPGADAGGEGVYKPRYTRKPQKAENNFK